MGKAWKRGKANATRKKYSVKIANKQFNKLVKRGKIKTKTPFGREKRTEDARNDVPEDPVRPNGKPKNVPRGADDEWEGDERDVLDMIGKDELNNFIQDTQKLSLWKAGDELTGKLIRRKRPLSHDNQVEEYEKKPRTAFLQKTKSRPLLPLKGPKGLIPVNLEDRDTELDADIPVVAGPAESGDVPSADTVVAPRSLVELYAERQRNLAELQGKVALLACSVVESPEENVRKLKELVNLFGDKSAFLTVRRAAALSLLEVFRDVLPAYRIRLPSDKEKEQKAKKDTKKLREYETALLRNYKVYLEKLKGSLSALRTGKKAKLKLPASDAKRRVRVRLAETAVDCLCGLLVAHPHFNYRNDVVATVVPLMANPNLSVASTCFQAIRDLYSHDILGEVSLEAVKCTVETIKARNYHVPREMLDTFLYLRIRDMDAKDQGKPSRKDMKIERQRSKALSRRENKRRKKMEKLQKQLLEVEGEESRDKKRSLHTEILNRVFTIYFHVLKSESYRSLLTPVMEGLSKFAHLINVDFYDDLVAALNFLLRKGDLDNHEALHCLCTVFTIISGQGKALNIDPQEFYLHLYKIMLKIHAGITGSDVSTLLSCLEVMLVKRTKSVTFQRMLAFVKRLCTCSLQGEGGTALGLLSTVRALMQFNRRTDVLLDSEGTQGSGVFLPDVEDPEHCNAHATALWELHPLMCHYHPVVGKYATCLSKGCPTQGDGQLPPKLLKLSPQELYIEYTTDGFDFVKKPNANSSAIGKPGKRSVIKDSVISHALKIARKTDDIQKCTFVFH